MAIPLEDDSLLCPGCWLGIVAFMIRRPGACLELVKRLDRTLLLAKVVCPGRLCQLVKSVAKIRGRGILEAQQRYFSYRAILVAIVSQKSFVLVFTGYRTIIARYVAKWGIARMCLCETKYQGGGIATFWGSADFP